MRCSHANRNHQSAISRMTVGASWTGRPHWPILPITAVAVGVLIIFSLVTAVPLLAQTEAASIGGVIHDSQGAAVPDADVTVTRIETDTVARTKTNGVGIYLLTGLVPGSYRMVVRKTGFKEIATSQFNLVVQQKLEQNFSLAVGSATETVNVDATADMIDTQDASVSTVVDRQFADRLPLNGRSFQSLIELTPGVVLTPNNGSETGQFSINGQRDYSNYWTVDGVSANIGFSAAGYVGEGMSGSLGGTNVFGGTNGLVSVDALQEFRIQTSTYAPEFGRTPGGQISIVTRSGSNQFHGTLFNYFRNEALDANDWFANQAGLRKPQERQNNFGGTVGGPIWKNKTFFFFSYEGMRLRLPQTAVATVPDTNPDDPYSRQYALPDFLPYLNAFPLPNGPEVLDGDGNHQGIAQFNLSYANPGSLNAYSLRIDHRFNDKLMVFGRYNYSPSSIDQRGLYTGFGSLSHSVSNTLTETVGATWTISPTIANDFRFNFSKTDNYTSTASTDFGGAIPLTSLPYPSQYTLKNSGIGFYIGSLQPYCCGGVSAGPGGFNQQRQFNVVDSLSVQKATHTLKFGVDYRRLSPSVWPGPGQNTPSFGVLAAFPDVASAETGTNAWFVGNSYTLPVTFLFRNLGAFAQDTWRLRPRLTMTYGVRWDVDFVPSTLSGPNFAAVTGFDLNNLANLASLPNTSPYSTRYGSFAPRLGLAYQLSQSDRWQTVVRGGFGLFYDLASSESGNLYSNYNYPFGSAVFQADVPDPFYIAPAPIVQPDAPGVYGTLYSVDPHLKMPYTLQWNFAIEQALGKAQTFTASYVGASGRNLLSTAGVTFTDPSQNPNLGGANLVTNAGSSSYNALQLQFQRRLSAGLQALASYSWAHSIDTGSGGSSESISNALPSANPNINRGSSDFDIRHAASAGITYDIPGLKGNALSNAILHGWSLENLFQVRSASPLDVFYTFHTSLSNGFYTDIRPDVVTDVPLYLYGSQYPGGKAINFNRGPVCPDGNLSVGPFCSPPVDSNGVPVRQGNLPRNALRGFGAVQWDFAVHREFPIHERIKLQFRAEMFNVLNHPNFGPPVNDLGYDPATPSAGFGLANAMLGRSLGGGNIGAGAFDPLYQIGGPRSIQLALKLAF